MDTWATHYFIADSCVARFKLVCSIYPTLVVCIADGARVRTGREILGCPIRIGEREWPTDLIVMPLRTDEMILGMDFMNFYGAILNLRTRTVSILAEDGTEHEVWGDDPKRNGAQISAVRAARLLDQGCTSYWCYALEVDRERPSLTDVPVVSEFADVFPDELPGLPPQRDVDLAIQLELGTRSISRVPYRMAPTEIAELKAQLEELAGKGYIRPSASP